jgi:hypothetical protein
MTAPQGPKAKPAAAPVPAAVIAPGIVLVVLKVTEFTNKGSLSETLGVTFVVENMPLSGLAT